MKRFLFVLLILLAPCLADAANYWVRPTGTMSGCTPSATAPAADSGYKSTINTGIACLAGGDTLNIRTGTYNERIALAWIIPNGIDDTHRTQLVASDGAGTAIMLPSSCPPDGVLNFPNAGDMHYMTFDGLVFDGTNCVAGTGSGGGQVVYLSNNAAFIRFINTTIQNGGIANVNAGDTTHGAVVAAPNAEFLNCTMKNNGLANNAVNPAGGYQWYISGGPGPITIDGCLVTGGGGYGIHIFGSAVSNVVVRNSTFTGNGITSYKNFLTAAIRLGGTGTGLKAYNNLIYNNYSKGIETASADRQIYNNTIYGNGSWGIQVDHDATVKNNITYGNSVNADGSFDIGAFDLTGVVASNNLCGTTGNLASGCASTSNPLFVNAGSQDFHLQSGSPARGLGANLGPPYNVDYAGVTRPSVGAWDAGALQFSTGSTPFTVTIQSISPGSGVNIAITPTDNNGNNNCGTPCTRVWNSGTTITLTAAATAGGNNFANWSGCTSQSGTVCTITNISTNLTVTATYQIPNSPNRTLTTASNPSGATIAATVAPVSVTPFTQVVPDSTALVLKANPTVQGPVWRSPLTTNSNDTSGNVNNGTDTSMSYSTGAVFNGTTSKIVVPASDFLRTLNEWTITATVTPSAGMTDFRAIAILNYVLGLYASTSGFTTSSSGHSCGTGSPIAFYEVNAASRTLCRTAALTNGATYKFVATRSLTGMELYVDGSLEDSITGLSDGAALPDNCSPPCSDGTFELGNSFFNEPLPGKLVNVSLYGRHFSSGDVTAYGNGTLSDGASFTSWQGCTSGSGVTCNVTMTQDRTVTANYPSSVVTTPALIIGTP